jgi:hypothetical protein
MRSCVPRSEPATCYVAALTALTEARDPFLVGGAYAVEHYTGIFRDTKDLDVFVHPRDSEAALEALAATGYRTELTFPHWLGKAFSGDEVIDVIFSSGNGLAEVDVAWFRHAADGTVLGVSVRLCPVEEMIWSKAFIMERERYDGADIAHLLRATGERLNWRRLIRRFGPHWRVLLSHLVLFGFIYPSERGRIPAWVMGTLIRRLQDQHAQPAPTEPVCWGTLLSRAQYLVDVENWGYRDARLVPPATMTAEAIADWTAAIEAPLPTARSEARDDDAAGGGDRNGDAAGRDG